MTVASAADGGLETIRGLLNFRTIYCKDIDNQLPRESVQAALEAVCPPSVGRVKIPTYQDGKSFVYAYLNFASEEEAASALKKWRFRLVIGDRPVRMFLTVATKEGMRQVFGPASNRFSVLVKNLDPCVDGQALYNRFVDFGDIYQCKVTVDSYGHSYGLVQYIDVWSVQRAIAGANDCIFHGTRLAVEPMRPRRGFGDDGERNVGRGYGVQHLPAPAAIPALASAPSTDWAPSSPAEAQHPDAPEWPTSVGAASAAASSAAQSASSVGEGAALADGPLALAEHGSASGSTEGEPTGAGCSTGSPRWGDDDYDITHGYGASDAAEGCDEARFYDAHRPSSGGDQGPGAGSESRQRRKSFGGYCQGIDRPQPLQPQHKAGRRADARTRTEIHPHLPPDERAGVATDRHGEAAAAAAAAAVAVAAALSGASSPGSHAPPQAPPPALAQAPPQAPSQAPPQALAQAAPHAPPQAPPQAPPEAPPPAPPQALGPKVRHAYPLQPQHQTLPHAQPHRPGPAYPLQTGAFRAGPHGVERMTSLPPAAMCDAPGATGQPSAPLDAGLEEQRLAMAQHMQALQHQQAALFAHQQHQQQQQMQPHSSGAADGGPSLRSHLSVDAPHTVHLRPSAGAPPPPPGLRLPPHGAMAAAPAMLPAVARVHEAMGRKGSAPAKVLAKQLWEQMGKLAVLMECPITQEAFIDPVVAADGHTYERRAITDWLEGGHTTSPVTNEPLQSDALVPNKLVQALAHDFRSG